MGPSKQIIGRAERISLPEFELSNLPAKVDTGAFSSSLDCSHTEIVEKDGKQVLKFILLHPGSPSYTGQEFYADKFEQTTVTNANGVKNRFVIFTKVILNDQTYNDRFTLSDRSKMRYPVLIGRKFLRQANLLVDVSKGEGLPNDEEERQL